MAVHPAYSRLYSPQSPDLEAMPVPSQPTHPASERIKLWLIRLYILFALAGFLYGVIQVKEAKRSLEWPSTLGKVIEARRGSDPVKPLVLYRYAVDGRQYEARRIAFRQVAGDETAPMLRRYRVGREVTVYFDPEDPKTAVLEVGFRWSDHLLLMGISLGMALAGIFIHQRFKRRSVSTNRPGEPAAPPAPRHPRVEPSPLVTRKRNRQGVDRAVFFYNKHNSWRLSWIVGTISFATGWVISTGESGPWMPTALPLMVLGAGLLVYGVVTLFISRPMLAIDRQGIVLYSGWLSQGRETSVPWGQISSAGIGRRSQMAIPRGETGTFPLVYFRILGDKPWAGLSASTMWRPGDHEIHLPISPKEGFGALIDAVDRFRPGLVSERVESEPALSAGRILGYGLDTLLILGVSVLLLLALAPPAAVEDFIADIDSTTDLTLSGLERSFRRHFLDSEKGPATIDPLSPGKREPPALWKSLLARGKEIRDDRTRGERQRFAESEALYLQALDDFEQDLGKGPLDIQGMRDLFGEIHSIFYTQRKHAELEPYLRREIIIYTEQLGGSRVLTGSVYEHLGHLLKKLERRRDAVQAYEAARRIYRRNKREPAVVRLTAVIENLQQAIRVGAANAARVPPPRTQGEIRLTALIPEQCVSKGKTFKVQGTDLGSMGEKGFFLGGNGVNIPLPVLSWKRAAAVVLLPDDSRILEAGSYYVGIQQRRKNIWLSDFRRIGICVGQ